MLDPNSRFTDDDCTSFVPYDIDEHIREWLMTGNSLDTFLEDMTNKYCIFHRSSAEQEKYIQLDIFFTALHQKLQKLPKSSRIAEDFSKSIYINPDFIESELSEMLPFYISRCIFYRSESLTLPIRSSDSRKKIKNFSGMDYPLMGETICLSDSNSYEATPKVLSEFIDDYMNECSRRSNNKKILKNCYPLYLFLFNNILTMQTIKNPSSISKVSGCSLNNPDYNLNPLKNMLKLQISPLKNMKINDKRSLCVKSNLYALRQFDHYIQAHPYLRFSFTLSRKIGNNHKQSVQNVDVVCDPLFTIWLFIRYSELFRIALTTKFLILSNDDAIYGTNSIQLPKNFFTAFNFEPNVFRYYPTFHNEYNDFVEEQARCLFEENKKLSVDQWLQIAQRIEYKVTYSPVTNDEGLSPWYDLARVELHEILTSFYHAIGINEETNYQQIGIETIKRFEEYYREYIRIFLSTP